MRDLKILIEDAYRLPKGRALVITPVENREAIKAIQPLFLFGSVSSEYSLGGHRIIIEKNGNSAPTPKH